MHAFLKKSQFRWRSYLRLVNRTCCWLGGVHGSGRRKCPHGGVTGRAYDLVLPVQPVVTQLWYPGVKDFLWFDLEFKKKKKQKLHRSRQWNETSGCSLALPSGDRYVPPCPGRCDEHAFWWTWLTGQRRCCSAFCPSGSERMFFCYCPIGHISLKNVVNYGSGSQTRVLSLTCDSRCCRNSEFLHWTVLKDAQFAFNGFEAEKNLHQNLSTCNLKCAGHHGSLTSWFYSLIFPTQWHTVLKRAEHNAPGCRCSCWLTAKAKLMAD